MPLYWTVFPYGQRSSCKVTTAANAGFCRQMSRLLLALFPRDPPGDNEPKWKTRWTTAFEGDKMELFFPFKKKKIPPKTRDHIKHFFWRNCCSIEGWRVSSWLYMHNSQISWLSRSVSVGLVDVCFLRNNLFRAPLVTRFWWKPILNMTP